jgi:hypothetical protein
MNKQEQLAVTEYLHLYKGCNVRHNDGWIGRLLGVNETLGRAFQPLKIEAPNGLAVWWNWKDITPILRPLSDFKMDELIDFIHVGQPEIDAQYSEFEEVLSDIKEQGINALHYDDVPPLVVFNQTRWLLSKHFDLFGLIEAGLAIDATTINNKNLNQ